MSSRFRFSVSKAIRSSAAKRRLASLLPECACDRIPYSTGNPKGSAYGVDNNQKVFLVIRMYLNRETKVASAPFDIIWGHAILLQKRRNPARIAITEKESIRSTHDSVTDTEDK